MDFGRSDRMGAPELVATTMAPRESSRAEAVVSRAKSRPFVSDLLSGLGSNQRRPDSKSGVLPTELPENVEPQDYRPRNENFGNNGATIFSSRDPPFGLRLASLPLTFARIWDR